MADCQDWNAEKEGSFRRRVVHRMPFRKSLKRDSWDPSIEAERVREQWKSTRAREGLYRSKSRMRSLVVSPFD